MEKSLFAKYIAYLKGFVGTITKKVNDSTSEATYSFKDGLTKKLSADGNWSSLNFDGTRVTADVVSLDSPLPLKRRDKITSASGEIPKVGMKMALNEKTMREIDNLVSRGTADAEIAFLVYDDATRCLTGIYEEIEAQYLQALSTGQILVDDTTNVGTGIRVDFGYLPGNSFGVTAPWSDPTTSKPLDDISTVLTAASLAGNPITLLKMDPVTFNQFAASTQVKEKYAFTVGFSGSNVQSPNLAQVNVMLLAEYRLQIKLVDRVVKNERDGVRTNQRPWATNKVIFLAAEKVGKLVYSTLAEATRQNKAVTYVFTDDYIMLKTWHSPEPFAEWTSSQALVIPVIENTGGIYSLNTEEANTSTQTEGDAVFNYKGAAYTKASAIAGLNAANPQNTLTVSSTDANINKAVNKLNDEQEALFVAALVVAP